jgi:hypothetical protein
MVATAVERSGVVLRAPACPPDDSIDHAGEQEDGNYDVPRFEGGLLHHRLESNGPVLLHIRTLYSAQLNSAESHLLEVAPVMLIELDACSGW